MRGLILTADDYGLAREFNRGILECAKENLLSGVSIMVQQNFIRPQDFLSFPNMDLGVHLELPQQATEKDIEKQIEQFKHLFKRAPDYLDGHRHCHITQENIEVFTLVAQKYRLPVRSRFSKDREYFQKNNVSTPNNFLDWHPSRKGAFLERIRGISSITEIVCHPGYYDPDSTYPYNKQRFQELKILKSQNFKEIFRAFAKLQYSDLDLFS